MKAAALAFQNSCLITLLYIENRYAGTGQTIVVRMPHNQFEINNSGSGSAITKQSLLSDEDMLQYFKEVKNAKYQLEYLKHILGFNVSQLAAILRVKRPTIYEWLEDKEPNRTNQERLDTIYSLFEIWEKEKSERLGGYLYKKIYKNKSLYDLLSEEIIDETLAREHIVRIKEVLLANKRLNVRRKELLSSAGFKPISREYKEQALKRLMRKV